MKCKNCKNLTKRIDSDGILYDSCEIIVDCPDTERERDCKYYAVATNADRIRAMSDEELAEWIYSINIDRYIGVPVKEWLNWLRQGADDDLP